MVISLFIFFQYPERILSLKRTFITWSSFLFSLTAAAVVLKPFLQVGKAVKNQVKSFQSATFSFDGIQK